MEELPYCVRIIQALGPTFVAIVAAMWAALISYRQWRSSIDKLKLDLFDRRYKVLLTVENSIKILNNNKTLIDADFVEFELGVMDKRFLFNKNICKTIDKLESSMRRIANLNDRIVSAKKIMENEAYSIYTDIINEIKEVENDKENIIADIVTIKSQLFYLFDKELNLSNIR